jgi:hypothetical protein
MESAMAFHLANSCRLPLIGIPVYSRVMPLALMDPPK